MASDALVAVWYTQKLLQTLEQRRKEEEQEHLAKGRQVTLPARSLAPPAVASAGATARPAPKRPALAALPNGAGPRPKALKTAKAAPGATGTTPVPGPVPSAPKKEAAKRAPPPTAAEVAQVAQKVLEAFKTGAGERRQQRLGMCEHRGGTDVQRRSLAQQGDCERAVCA